MYSLARSGSSAKDQIMYVPTRLDDLRELSEPIQCGEQTYTDCLRFFSGDSPARALEVGQQCNGRCH